MERSFFVAQLDKLADANYTVNRPPPWGEEVL